MFYEDGKQEIVDPKSEGGKGIASLLTRKLHEVNLQARCVFSEEDIQEIKQLVVKLGKVKEVHLTLDCGGKTLKARVDWENKKVISVEDI